MQMKATMRYHFTSIRIVIFKMTDYNKCWWRCRDTGRVRWCSHCEKQIIKIRITMWFSNSTSGYTHKRIESRDFKIYLYTHVHSNISHSSQEVKATPCPLMDKCISKMLCVHTMEYYSALKRKEILTHGDIDQPWRSHAK